MWVANTAATLERATEIIAQKAPKLTLHTLKLHWPGMCTTTLVAKQEGYVTVIIDCDELSFPMMADENGQLNIILRLALLFRMPMIYGCGHFTTEDLKIIAPFITDITEDDVTLLKSHPINKFSVEWAYILKKKYEQRKKTTTLSSKPAK